MFTINDFIGHVYTGRVFCNGHTHSIAMRIVSVNAETESLNLVTIDDEPICTIDMIDETTAIGNAVFFETIDDEFNANATIFDFPIVARSIDHDREIELDPVS